MAYEKKPGDVSIFPNRKKLEGDRSPDFKGEILTPDGELLEIALWAKPSNFGTFYAGKVQKPRPKFEEPKAPADIGPDGVPLPF